MRTRVAILAAAGLLVWFAEYGGAYSTGGRRWAAGSTVVMHLQFGSSSGPLIDGSNSWNTPAENALSIWNPFLSSMSFSVVRDSSVGNSSGNRINNVSFGDDVYGEPFGSDVLAVATSWYRTSDNAYTEGDVVFNRKYTWNSYRGNRRSGTIDLRRVALHEFGHVLGLTHPDDHSQSVSAIMNSKIGDLDSLQSDDTNGARAIYGAAPAAPVVTDALQPGARLLAGQSLTSANKRYRLVYQTDGNLVLYDDGDGTIPWASGTGGTSAGQALMQTDGHFVVYDAQVVGVWGSGTAGNANARLVLQNDGNLVIYSASGQPLWGSR